MADKKRVKTRYVDINVRGESFVSKLTGGPKKFDLSDIALLRSLITNEKAKILHVIKTQNPSSIYQLARFLGRDFKAVWKDLNVLKRFGIIEFHLNKKGKRKSLQPILTLDSLQIIINI
jgi:predicted transcriptional regulator